MKAKPSVTLACAAKKAVSSRSLKYPDPCREPAVWQCRASGVKATVVLPAASYSRAWALKRPETGAAAYMALSFRRCSSKERASSLPGGGEAVKALRWQTARTG